MERLTDGCRDIKRGGDLVERIAFIFAVGGGREG